MGVNMQYHMEEAICWINPVNDDLFAGLIQQIVTFCRINPANSDLFAGLIWQIVTYLRDNPGLEKRGGSHALIVLLFDPEN